LRAFLKLWNVENREETEILTTKEQGHLMREKLKENPVITAPMAGITDRAYREILQEMGAGICFCEMVSDKGLNYGDKKTNALLNIHGEDSWVGAQLCGSEPESMAKAAQIIEKMGRDSGNLAVIDINMGCPVKKVVSNGEGSRLMQTPEIAVEIIRQVRSAVSLPVTAKMRLGWDDGQKNVLELASRLQEAGADAITIHGRTRQQFYSGKADWTLINEAKKNLDIPVIGNGDIFSAADALKRLQESKCDGIMLGRGMVGNPWLVRDVVRAVKKLPPLPAPDIEERIAMAIRHLYRETEICGEYTGVRSMRSHLPWYIKGQRGAAAMRNRINQLDRAEAIEELLLQYAADIKNGAV
jgi:tRNA-dihydrouridine synthase B